MCGFVGLISKRSKKINLMSLKKMNQAILHRGPDDEGYFSNAWLGLGFRRLAIIDLSSRGHQPMQDASKRYVCVFNGEIYNYRSLRHELETAGVRFYGHSDTEVLLAAYIHWGEACLHRLLGMFAFVIADLKTCSVFIARDFPGIKPLYFTEDPQYYYFASEVKAFAQMLPLSVDVTCYREHFNFRYLAGAKTHFKNVFKVLPGEFWRINHRAEITKKRYFDVLKTFETRDSHCFSGMQSIVECTKKQLHDSFLLHTRSDVGYCIQLSGGVDSSYLTAVLAERAQPLHTFSVQLDGHAFDESTYQQQVAQRYGTQHCPITLTGKDYTREIERATYYLEAPIVHSGSVFLMNLCRHIGRTSKVVLTGEGADELFAGYWRHKPTFYEQSVFQLQRWGIKGRCLPNFSKLATLKKLLQADVVLNSHRYQSANAFETFFSCSSPSSHVMEREIYVRRIGHCYVNAILAYDQLSYLTSLLDRQDKLSMSYSVEARVPYCCQDLYRLINQIPGRYKIYGGERKAVLKKCAQHHLSSALMYRRKNGFRLPLENWYRDDKLMGSYLELLTDSTARQRGIYSHSTLERAVSAFRQGDNQYAKPVIMLVNLELWHRVYGL